MIAGATLRYRLEWVTAATIDSRCGAVMRSGRQYSQGPAGPARPQSCDRKGEHESGPLPCSRVVPQLGAHGLGQAVGQGEAQPEARRGVRGFVDGLAERLKETGAGPGVEAGAVVGN